MWGSVKLCTYWLSGRTGRENIWLVLTESQMFSRPAWPKSVDKHILSYDRCVIFWQSENAFKTAFTSFRARFSSRALRVFQALSLISRVRPSELFSHMVFQRNCARGRTDHMIKCDESRDSTVISRSRSCATCLGLQAIFSYYLTFNLFFVRKVFTFLRKNFSIKNESCPRWVEPPTSLF